MGYSHSFRGLQPIAMGKWIQILDATQQTFKKLPLKSNNAGGHFSEPVILQREYDDISAPLLDGNAIIFNGPGDLGHDTFVLNRRGIEGSTHCKTNRKPYDFAVCTVLILAHRFAPGCLRIKSDGNRSDWLHAYQHLKDVMGYTDLEIPPGVMDPSYDYVKMNPVEPWWKMSDAPSWF